MSMNRINIQAKNNSFDALILKACNPIKCIIFAVGSGGNPERHLPLLISLYEKNYTVIAPFFERITSSVPSAEELLIRKENLLAALDFIGDPSLEIVGLGHSIGATLLVALAGGEMYMRSGERLPIARDNRLKKLVLLTPPTGFFQAPNALDFVNIPLQVWSGSCDTITPPEQINVLRNGLPTSTVAEFYVAEGAGHFSFMNTLPPNVNDSMENRHDFLIKLSNEVSKFISL